MTHQLDLPTGTAADPVELKQALAEACLASVGADAMPAEWLGAGELAARWPCSSAPSATR